MLWFVDRDLRVEPSRLSFGSSSSPSLSVGSVAAIVWVLAQLQAEQSRWGGRDVFRDLEFFGWIASGSYS